MIVDDDAQVLQALKALIEPLEYEVVALADSQAAALQIEAEKFDGVFVDACMPHPDGFELTQRIRTSRINAQIPVVMLTGYDDADTMRKGFKCGITFFLGKPVTPERILSVCTSMCAAMLRERRAHARLPLRTSVHCTWGEYDEREFHGDSLNISAGGMLIESAAFIPAGQPLTVEFMLTYNRPIRVRAQVVRVEASDRIAVQFTDLRPEQLEAIQHFIDRGIKPPR